MTASIQTGQGRYSAPPFDEARVHDVMRTAVIACRSTTSVRDVARMMTAGKTHSVVVEDVDAGGRPWGVVSALDIAAATDSDLDDLHAIDIATTGVVTVSANESLPAAARLMIEHGITNLVVVEPDTKVPCGVLSAWDLAAVLTANGSVTTTAQKIPEPSG